MKGGAPGNAGGGKKSKTAKLASFARNTPTTTRVSRRAIERDATRAKRLVVFGEIVGTPLQKMSDGTGEARSRARSRPNVSVSVIRTGAANTRLMIPAWTA
jgi:hypothetical protein